MITGRLLRLIPLVLLGALVGSLAGSLASPKGEIASQLDLNALVREVGQRPALVADGKYRGKTCSEFARQFGRRLDRSFRALPYRDERFDASRVWKTQIAELNRLSLELATRRMRCDSERVVGRADTQLSPEFRRHAHGFVGIWKSARVARHHPEWRSTMVAVLRTRQMLLNERHRR
jgi:hypothetical protein